MQTTPKYAYLYLLQTLIFPLNNMVTVSVISLAGCQTINLGSMPIKHISWLWVHPGNAANLLISSLQTSLLIVSHLQTLYVVLVLNLIAILISENTFLWHVVPASIIFVTFALFNSIVLFQLPKPLLQHSLLVGWISAIIFFITLHLRIF